MACDRLAQAYHQWLTFFPERRDLGNEQEDATMTAHETTVRDRHRAPEVDFDFFHPHSPGEDLQAAWIRIARDNPPAFWTARNGGHWVVTEPAAIAALQSDWARFSSGGSRIPPAERPYPLLPLEADPPAHAAYRLLIAPAFSPSLVARTDETMRRVAVETIDALVPRAGCEFVSEFAKVLPIAVFLGMMELPLEDRHELLPHAEAIARAKDQNVANAARQAVATYLDRWIEERRRNPGTDAISRIANGRPHGRALTEAEVSGMCAVVLVGGLDTVAALLSFTAAHLARHPEHRRRLREEPAVVPQAVEEFCRRFGLVNQSRVVVADTELAGVSLSAGDRVLVPNVLIGLDPERVLDPLEVDFDRVDKRYGLFGAGPHLCPGAPLARRELKVFLEEWLARIPDFKIAPGTRCEAIGGTVGAIEALHLTWPVG